jgi:8-oxo-dGTP pyrophosphatase MutT (NUDIX family)
MAAQGHGASPLWVDPVAGASGALAARPPDGDPDARRSSETVPILQSGVLAYRRTAHGELRVLLVSKRRSKEWSIPKGTALSHLTFAENAAKEAFEEAGVKGEVLPQSIGMFRATKRSPDRLVLRVVEVWVYALEVAECLASWPEKGERRIRWVSCRKAAAQLREPLLADLCRRLGQERSLRSAAQPGG